jgi:hypothetical protein
MSHKWLEELSTADVLSCVGAPSEAISTVCPGKPCALYRVISQDTYESYFGISVDPVRRWKTHRKRARQGHKSKLYSLMREHGADRFLFQVVRWFPSPELARQAELNVIDYGLAGLNEGKF